MPNSKHESVASLHLDLKNFRTVHQPDEEHAINALIGIEPDRFWALMESLLDDGYSPTENIIVLDNSQQLVVKEGNRRIAALKLILGLQKNIEVPENIQQRIRALSAGWKKENSDVPCAVYNRSETALVDRLVSRTHAKGEKAGRTDWTAVARARYGRDQNNASELGLDLLEKYLSLGKNRSTQQAERWAGDYPLTVLDEAIQKLTPHLTFKSVSDLVAQYPAKNKRLLDQILYDIGISHLGFKELRAGTPFWGTAYGLQSKPQATQTQAGSGAAKPTASGGAGAKKAQAPTHASNDPKSVRKALKEFKVRGKGREKIVTLVNEIKSLRHEEYPHAFCFLLRSIFELSAKAYCSDHKKSGGPSAQKSDGSDKKLVDVLRDITKHRTHNGADKAKVKLLHGAMTELGKPNGILSVTSFNQLIHSPSFSISPSDISLLFWNVFPLLEEMNG
ncbi:MAG: hypothetical protein JWM21_3510 [Acidobacteria bacterium]|nr:hypothetical protein [Acidobacteriota bacterium]